MLSDFRISCCLTDCRDGFGLHPLVSSRRKLHKSKLTTQIAGGSAAAKLKLHLPSPRSAALPANKANRQPLRKYPLQLRPRENSPVQIAVPVFRNAHRANPYGIKQTTKAEARSSSRSISGCWVSFPASIHLRQRRSFPHRKTEVNLALHSAVAPTRSQIGIHRGWAGRGEGRQSGIWLGSRRISQRSGRQLSRCLRRHDDRKCISAIILHQDPRYFRSHGKAMQAFLCRGYQLHLQTRQHGQVGPTTPTSGKYRFGRDFQSLYLQTSQNRRCTDLRSRNHRDPRGHFWRDSSGILAGIIRGSCSTRPYETGSTRRPVRDGGKQRKTNLLESSPSSIDRDPNGAFFRPKPCGRGDGPDDIRFPNPGRFSVPIQDCPA